MTECHQTDVLIIGSGIAGATAALMLTEADIHVTVVTRASDPADSSTLKAQGGIIYRGENDTAQLLEKDILRAGAGLSHPPAVKILADEGPDLVKQLLIEKLGIDFDREKNGHLSLVAEGGHSLPRILHTTDATGKTIEQALIKTVKNHPKITLLKGHTAIDLLTPQHHSLNRLEVYSPRSCVGAYLLDRHANRVVRCLANKTILSTGGLGQIYLWTTNPTGARGDGIAMAQRMGARVINNQFIQFHPTTFFSRHSPHFLISEAIRGAGARLVNADGEPFMQKYDSHWKDLAPRDIVSRSIHREMLLNDTPNVYLDLASYIPSRKIKNHFPNIYQKCLQYGVDISTDLVPVVPAAHYANGGVWVDEWGRTTISDLYATGEVSCTGVHGANRLASTSLLEGLVWGYRTAQHIRENLAGTSKHDPDTIPPWEDAGKYAPDPALINQDMSVIKHIMWNYVGLIRNSWRLDRAMRELRNLENEIVRFYRVTKVTDSLIGLRNSVRTAIIVTNSAWKDKKSIGCHYRED